MAGQIEIARKEMVAAAERLEAYANGLDATVTFDQVKEFDRLMNESAAKFQALRAALIEEGFL